MKKDRRSFIKLAGAAGIGLAGNKFYNGPDLYNSDRFIPGISQLSEESNASMILNSDDIGVNLIGPYGSWAAGLTGKDLPSLSFRRKEWKRIDAWKKTAKKRLAERLAIPSLEGVPAATVVKEYSFDGLHIEELKWQLPYGRPTEAILLKPSNVTGRLPGILAFHDHGGNKYFGTRKITKTSDNQHPLMVSHQMEYYEGKAWANEVAKKGYVVLVADAFPFASRRVMMQDIPVSQRQGLDDNDPEDPENIIAYNRWAGSA